jgi:hypothetical protein
MNEMGDKRNKTRVEFRSEATVSHDNTRITGSISNLSLKGLFLFTDAKLPLNTPVDVSISLSGSTTNLTINISGTIIRIEKDGFAVEFMEMELDSFIHLRNIIFYADKELHEFYEFM